MAASAAAIATRVNFLQLSSVVLDDIPNHLRDIFKQRILAKYEKQWVDNREWGAWLIQKERWLSKLLPHQRHRLSCGNSQEWNSHLLIHLLLYSSHCLMADPISITQASLQHQSNMVVSSIHDTVDLTELFLSGDKAIFDLGQDIFCSEVVTVHKDHLFLKHAFESTQTQFQSTIIVPFYKCKPEWLAVEELYFLCSESLGYCKTAMMTDMELYQVIQEIVAIYTNLNIPQQLCKSRILAGEHEKIPVLELAEMVQHYTERWMMEYQHSEQMTRLIDELFEEIVELKGTLVQLMNEDIPEVKGTLHKIETTLGEAEVVAKDLRLQQEIVPFTQAKVAELVRILQAVGNVKSQLKNISASVTPLWAEVISRKESQLHSHAIALQQHEIELKKKEVQCDNLQQQQENPAARVNHATITPKQAGECRESDEKLKSAVPTIANREKQLLGEIVKIGHKLSQIEEKAVDGRVALQSQVSTVRSEFKKTDDAVVLCQESNDEPLLKLNPSHFEGEIAYYSEKYHCGTRKWLFDDLKRWREGVQGEGNASMICLVTGNPGMGKSVVAAKVCAMEEEKGTLAGCFFFQHQKHRRNNPKMLVQTLVHQLYSNIPDYRDLTVDLLAEVDLNMESALTLFTKLILEPLNQLPKEHSDMYIVIDALDECDFESRQILFKLIIHKFVKLPKWLNIVLTTRPDQKIIQKLNKVKPVLELRPDDPRNIHDLEIYLQDNLHERMQQTELKAAIDLLIKESQGMFLYFHFAIDTLLEYKGLEEIVPAGIGDYYEQNFARLYEKLGKIKYITLIQAVTAALDDLPVQLVSYLLDIDVTEASSVIDIVSTVLPVHNKCIHIFHKSVYDWLSGGEAEKYGVSPTEGHLHLAIQCYTILQEIKSTATTPSDIDQLFSSQIWKYAVQNLVMHLCSTNPEQFTTFLSSNDAVWQEELSATLVSVLSDLQFVFYKVRLSGGHLEDILEDYNKAIEVLTGSDSLTRKLNICKNFLLQQADLLQRLPHLIFQCALNSSNEIAKQFNVKQYLANPIKAWPELKVYLELARESETSPSQMSSLSTYRTTDLVVCCTQTPDEQLLICCVEEGFIHIWNKETGELVNKRLVDNCLDAECSRVTPTKAKHSDKAVLQLISRVKKVSVSPDGKMIVYGNVNEALDADGETVALITGIVRDTNNSTFSPDGKKLLSWTIPATGYDIPIYVKVWNFESQTCIVLEDIENRKHQPLTGCFSHDSQYAFCGHKDARISQWEVCTGEPIAVIYTDGKVIMKGSEEFNLIPPLEKEDAVTQLECTRNGHFMVACCQSGILIWDATGLVLLQTITPDHGGAKEEQLPEFTACSFSSDGRFLVAGTSDGYVMTWVLQPGSEQPFEQQICCKLNTTSFKVGQCFFDSHLNIICSLGFYVYIHSYAALSEATFEAQGKESSKVNSGYPCLSNCQILPDEKSVVTLNDYKLCLLHVPSLNLVSTLSERHVHSIGPWSANMKYFLAFTPNGSVMVVSFNLLNHWQLDLPDGPVKWPNTFCRWSVSSKALVLKSSKGRTYLLYDSCGKYTALQISKDSKAPLTCLEFSHDGDLFISADVYSTTLIWQVTTVGDKPAVQKVKELALGFTINKLATFGDKTLHVSSGLNIHTYSWPECEQISVMERHRPSVRMIVLSPDRSLVVSASELQFPPNTMEVIIWEALSGELVSCLPLIHASVSCLSFVCGNQYVCFYTQHEGMIQIHEVATGALVSCLSFPIGIFSLTASSDLVCILTDGSVKFVKLHSL